MGHHFGHFELGRDSSLLNVLYIRSNVQAHSGPFMLFTFNFAFFPWTVDSLMCKLISDTGS